MKAKEKVNKSQAIRDVLAKDPTAKPVAIHETLRQRGIKVGFSLISQVKYGQASRNRRGAGKPAGRRSAAWPSRNGDAASLDMLLAAKACVEACGGAEHAVEAIKAYGRIAG